MKKNKKINIESILGSFFTLLGVSYPLVCGLLHLYAAHIQYDLYERHEKISKTQTRYIDVQTADIHPMKLSKFHSADAFWVKYAFIIGNQEYIGSDLLKTDSYTTIQKYSHGNSEISIEYSVENPSLNKLSINFEGKIYESYYWLLTIGWILSIIGAIIFFMAIASFYFNK
jgi:hypothetical protein